MRIKLRSSNNNNRSPDTIEDLAADALFTGAWHPLPSNAESTNNENGAPTDNNNANGQVGTADGDDLSSSSSSSSLRERAGGHSSSIGGAIFNFTNCIVGAGAIGLGGAFAQSGGLVSIVTLIFFAVLTKISLDLVIRLSVLQVQQPGRDNDNANDSGNCCCCCSYEDLARMAFGYWGYLIVLGSKFLYASGCLVAYVIVVKDNFGPAVLALIYGRGHEDEASNSFFGELLSSDVWLTWLVSLVVILPLCLLRDMTPLASFSAVGILSIMAIVSIVIYLFWTNPHNEIRGHGGTTYENWFEIRWLGYLQNLGTFTFTFVSQHTVHLAFGSLRPDIRTVDNWKKISTASIAISGSLSLLIGVFVYMTFWEATRSDIFELYPPIPVVDFAKLLLCVAMLLTFPLPFFTCRELLVVLFTTGLGTRVGSIGAEEGDDIDDDVGVLEEEGLATSAAPDLREPLLSRANDSRDGDSRSNHSLGGGLLGGESAMSIDLSVLSAHAMNAVTSVLLPGDDRQLKLPYHIATTIKLWVVVTGLAIAAPNLGDVLDLVGCASGTIIAFVFPGLLSLKLQGFNYTALTILLVGGAVGTVGTFYSTKKLIADV